jgi:hypothetical protein
MKAWIALAIACAIGVGLVATGMVPLPESVTKLVHPPAPSAALPRVELKALRSETGFLQGDFVISNTNAFPIANSAIHCDVHDPSGAVVHSFDFVIDQTVAANDKKTINSYKFGFWPQQSSRMDCRSVSMERR